MPRIDTDEDVDIDDAPTNGASAHEETEVEADVDAKNQVQNELANDVAEHDGPAAGEDERNRVSDENEQGQDGEEEYEVEAIRGYEFQGKGKNKQLLYLIKWKGFPESDNTWEPEENLEDARDILAKYHHKNGGAPQPEATPRVKSKSSRKNLKQNSEDPADESSEPSAKRQRKDPDALSDWLPKTQSWESDVAQIDTVERDQATNKLYVYLKFKNGKRTKVTNEKIHKHCPLALLRFYESHLNFNAA